MWSWIKGWFAPSPTLQRSDKAFNHIIALGEKGRYPVLNWCNTENVVINAFECSRPWHPVALSILIVYEDIIWLDLPKDGTDKPIMMRVEKANG